MNKSELRKLIKETINELELGDKEFTIAGEDGIDTRDINRTVIKLIDSSDEMKEVAGYVQLNVLDLMVRGVDKVGKPEIYEAWEVFSKALDDNSVQGI